MKKNIYIITTCVVILCAFILITFFIIKKQSALEINSDGQNIKDTQNSEGIVSGEELEINFNYPVGWDRFDGELDSIMDISDDSFMFSHPEERSVIFISRNEIPTDSSVNPDNELDLEITRLLNLFEDSNDYNLIENTAAIIKGMTAKDITLSYQNEYGLFKVRLVVIKHRGYFYNLSLFSDEYFEEDMPTFEQLVNSVILTPAKK